MNIDLRDFGWYKAFTFFKLAVIFEGIHYRYAHGLTVGDGFEGIGALIEPLAAYGHAALVDHTAGK
jgi:aminoglycoside phosphotransferase (APT) family kinase protein